MEPFYKEYLNDDEAVTAVDRLKTQGISEDIYILLLMIKKEQTALQTKQMLTQQVLKSRVSARASKTYSASRETNFVRNSRSLVIQKQKQKN